MERPTLTLIAALAGTLLLGGCSGGSEAQYSKDEQKNFKEGMTPEHYKQVGPPPTIPEGPLPTYKEGSEADKAQGR